ncbi:hypothetical protein [Saccharibacter floricola]|nr:hypothetical protein [Saccharibacter floricola]
MDWGRVYAMTDDNIQPVQEDGTDIEIPRVSQFSPVADCPELG